jgi:hypothetical protein
MTGFIDNFDCGAAGAADAVAAGGAGSSALNLVRIVSHLFPTIVHTPFTCKITSEQLPQC